MAKKREYRIVRYYRYVFVKEMSAREPEKALEKMRAELDEMDIFGELEYSHDEDLYSFPKGSAKKKSHA
ncbi:MAG: hypothetical protein HPY53_12495 [Brevinematales bacterium]|nr:hypothetical protein [Brevinematales bacterium]